MTTIRETVNLELNHLMREFGKRDGYREVLDKIRAMEKVQVLSPTMIELDKWLVEQCEEILRDY